MARLDVTKASPKQKEKILEYAADVRKFEIGLFGSGLYSFGGLSERRLSLTEY
jgi:hypothetical protein